MVRYSGKEARVLWTGVVRDLRRRDGFEGANTNEHLVHIINGRTHASTN